MKITATLALALLSTGFVSQMQSATAPERLDMKIRQDFFAGFGGDANALAKGMKTCEEILAGNPKHAEALVWHGGGLYFQAGRAFQTGDQENGMRLFQAGLKEMDSAVAFAPEMIAVRIPRGATLLTGSRGIPDPNIARPLIEKGLSDYEFALSRQESNWQNMGVHPRGELLFGLAEGHSRMGNEEKARLYFQRILTEMKATPYADRAELWMKEKSLPIAKTGCIGCHVK